MAFIFQEILEQLSANSNDDLVKLLEKEIQNIKDKNAKTDKDLVGMKEKDNLLHLESDGLTIQIDSLKQEVEDIKNQA